MASASLNHASRDHWIGNHSLALIIQHLSEPISNQHFALSRSSFGLMTALQLYKQLAINNNDRQFYQSSTHHPLGFKEWFRLWLGENNNFTPSNLDPLYSPQYSRNIIQAMETMTGMHNNSWLHQLLVLFCPPLLSCPRSYFKPSIFLSTSRGKLI